ncbi:MAG: TetR/AcrR family transcriptional regulator [Spirochaetales bacterium]|nr:TetR/AcrR family transcriptional regulator [Spirochaetales bacterium]
MDTRENILDLTFRTLLEEGYEKVSLNSLIRKSRLTKGAFYHYFQSKDELIEEVINTYLISQIEQFARELEKGKGSTTEKLSSMAERIEIILGHLFPSGSEEQVSDFFSLLMGVARDNENIRKMEKRTAQTIITFICHIIDEGKAGGAVRDEVEAKETARLIYYSVRGTMMEWALHKEGSLRERLDGTIKGFLSLIG